MSASGSEDDINEAAAAAQRESFAELRSWTVWGAITRDAKERTTRKGKQELSRFSGQWIAKNAPCCLKAECPQGGWDQPDRVLSLVVLGDEETNLRFEIAGGEFSFFLFSFFSIFACNLSDSA